jgi:hypothetical protein
MGVAFWLLFIIQLLVVVPCYALMLKVERETPTEEITPATENEVEVF